MSKAKSNSTADAQGSIDKRAEWNDETREFYGHIWVCEICGERDTRGEEYIDHAAGCPEGSA